MSDEDWDTVLNTNLRGVYYCIRSLAPMMIRARTGHIINISSIYGLVSPDQRIYEFRRKNGATFFKPVAYSVSKSALLNLTRYLAGEIAADQLDLKPAAWYEENRIVLQRGMEQLHAHPRPGVRALLRCWQQENLLHPSRDAASVWIRSLEGTGASPATDDELPEICGI